MISIIESLPQFENESRSENIKCGINQRVVDGSSKLYDRKCYGYMHDKNGKPLQGKSVVGIMAELERLGIKSPTGKDKWCKRTMDVMLSNA